MTSAAPAIPDHLIELPDGRVLGLNETGDPDGRPVVLLASAPGSRRFDPDPEVTAAAGVRLITVDRAGYGASTPLPSYASPSVAGHAEDLAHAMRQLGLSEVQVVGWSAGGRVALGLAALHPSLVSLATLVATPAPHDHVPWIPEEQAAALADMRTDPAAGYVRLTEMLEPMMGDPEAGVAMVAIGASDQDVLADEAVRARLVEMIRESARQGAYGAAADIVAAEAVPWRFEPADVRDPIELLYGEADAITPEHGEWYRAQVPGARLRTVPGGGHLIVITEWKSILASAG